eukprot:Amastigsp_a339399_2754.p2 type:complete len:157 gc:universal Amastigsp_a339399_2754:149-619(+)
MRLKILSTTEPVLRSGGVLKGDLKNDDGPLHSLHLEQPQLSKHANARLMAPMQLPILDIGQPMHEPQHEPHGRLGQVRHRRKKLGEHILPQPQHCSSWSLNVRMRTSMFSRSANVLPSVNTVTTTTQTASSGMRSSQKRMASLSASPSPPPVVESP